jgi:hypothetical protein
MLLSHFSREAQREPQRDSRQPRPELPQLTGVGVQVGGVEWQVTGAGAQVVGLFGSQLTGLVGQLVTGVVGQVGGVGEQTTGVEGPHGGVAGGGETGGGGTSTAGTSRSSRPSRVGRNFESWRGDTLDREFQVLDRAPKTVIGKSLMGE